MGWCSHDQTSQSQYQNVIISSIFVYKYSLLVRISCFEIEKLCFGVESSSEPTPGLFWCLHYSSGLNCFFHLNIVNGDTPTLSLIISNSHNFLFTGVLWYHGAISFTFMNLKTHIFSLPKREVTSSPITPLFILSHALWRVRQKSFKKLRLIMAMRQ